MGLRAEAVGVRDVGVADALAGVQLNEAEAEGVREALTVRRPVMEAVWEAVEVGVRLGLGGVGVRVGLGGVGVTVVVAWKLTVWECVSEATAEREWERLRLRVQDGAQDPENVGEGGDGVNEAVSVSDPELVGDPETDRVGGGAVRVRVGLRERESVTPGLGVLDGDWERVPGETVVVYVGVRVSDGAWLWVAVVVGLRRTVPVRLLVPVGLGDKERERVVESVSGSEAVAE